MSLLWRVLGLWLVAAGAAGLVRPRTIIRYRMSRQVGFDDEDLDPDDRQVRITQVTGAAVLVAGLALVVVGDLPV